MVAAIQQNKGSGFFLTQTMEEKRFSQMATRIMINGRYGLGSPTNPTWMVGAFLTWSRKEKINAIFLR